MPNPYLLHHLLEQAAAAQPSKEVVVDLVGARRSFTYQIFYAMAAHCAAALQSEGLERGEALIQLTGDMLDISWPNAGGRLQSKTNILSANWVDVPNSTTTNRVIVPIGPGSEGVFYRLALP